MAVHYFFIRKECPFTNQIPIEVKQCERKKKSGNKLNKILVQQFWTTLYSGPFQASIYFLDTEDFRIGKGPS